MHFRSFEDLAAYLRHFTTCGDRGGYDFGGALHLFEACLENLQRHMVDGDFEELADRLAPENISFLKQLATGGTDHTGQR